MAGASVTVSVKTCPSEALVPFVAMVAVRVGPDRRQLLRPVQKAPTKRRAQKKDKTEGDRRYDGAVEVQ